MAATKTERMLNRIVRFALEFRGIVLVLAAVLIGYGVYVASRVKLDVFPEFVQPQVTIQTEAPGLAPEQVEVLVTRPVENSINGAGELESVRSESIQGLSVITAVFKEGTNIFTARQTLAEKLAETAGLLPDHVKAPKMSALTSSTMDLLKIGLVSKTMSPRESPDVCRLDAAPTAAGGSRSRAAHRFWRRGAADSSAGAPGAAAGV